MPSAFDKELENAKAALIKNAERVFLMAMERHKPRWLGIYFNSWEEETMFHWAMDCSGADPGIEMGDWTHPADIDEDLSMLDADLKDILDGWCNTALKTPKKYKAIENMFIEVMRIFKDDPRFKSVKLMVAEDHDEAKDLKRIYRKIYS